MRVARRGIVVIGVFGVLLAGLACLHKSSGSVTPWERVSAYNASFSELNNVIEQGTEAASSSCAVDPNTNQSVCVLSVSQAEPVIRLTGKVAITHQRINSILEKGSAVTAADLQTVRDLLTEIADSGSALVKGGSLGVKNPRSQQTIAADLQALVNLGNALISQLQQLQPKSELPARPNTNGLAFFLSFGLIGMAGMGVGAGNPAFWEAIVALVLQAGPLAVSAFLKLEALLNLGPDEKQNIANAFKQSDVTDQETIDHANAWLKANGFSSL